MNKGKIISYRATEREIEAIENFKDKNSREGFPRIKDSDVMRYALSLIAQTRPDELAEKKDDSEVSPETSEPELTDEQKALGYQYIKGELCDIKGFPVEQVNGDYVERGGQIFATDPGRAELKEIAKENAEAVVSETDFGKVNPAMAEILGQSEKADTLRKHAEPGMLTQQDGVDDSFNEDNFINE